MTRLDTARTILAAHSISETRGFLPEDDPLQRLVEYPAWEELAGQLSDLLNASRVRAEVAALPALSTERLQTRAELERAMMVLSFLAHAYLRERDDDCREVPAQLAVPWCEVARRLDRPPVLSHASVVLHNWRRLDPDGPIALGNLATLLQFHGGLDEAWFYLTTVEIEATGARGVTALADAVLAARRDDAQAVIANLATAADVLNAVSACLVRLYEKCDPYIFYHRVRPFLSSLEEIDYLGVTPRRQSHHGGSAAQSSLVPTFDSALGVQHPDEPSSSFMTAMFRYMPSPHRAFLAWIAQTPLRAYCDRTESLQAAWSACAEALRDFRRHHLKIVARYIMAHVPKTDGARGTGGTNPMVFLQQMARDTVVLEEDHQGN